MAIFLDDGLHTLLGVQFLYFIDCKRVYFIRSSRTTLRRGIYHYKKCKCIGLPFSFESNINDGRRRIRTADLIRLMRVSP